MTISVNSASSNPGLLTSGASSKTSQSDANASQDRFLKLLVAQLNNQDPMNPMDNAQMTSQMAQINTVSGITQLNETVKSLSSQFAASQLMQGASILGHDVLTSGSSLTVNAGQAKGAIDLPSNADKVTVQIMTPGGQVIDTMNLGVRAAGRHNFEWDASGYTGSAGLNFKVTATQGGKEVPTTAMSRDTVVGIGNDGLSMNLQLKGRQTTVAYEDIKAIL